MRFLFLTAFSVLYMLQSIAFAVPASHHPLELSQPGGDRVNARLRGDEWSNRVETEDGYTIGKGSDGAWYYVERFEGDRPRLHSTPAHRPPPPGIEKRLRSLSSPQRSASATGGVSETTASGTSSPYAAPMGTFNGKLLFILASFSDRSGTYTEANFASFLSTINTYYNKVSYGNVTFSPATETYGTANNGVVGWVNLGYAHPNPGASFGTSSMQIARDAIIAAAPYVNYAAYDTNNDGYVDASELAIVVIAAGYEASYGSYSPSLWGHKWSISGSVTAPVINGKTIASYHNGASGYAEFGEIHQSNASNAHQATLGIMIHELGHLVFNFPDLYDSDGTSRGVGYFDSMSYGCWGKASTDAYGGQTPVVMGGYIKNSVGWASSVAGSSFSLYAAGSTSATSSNVLAKIPTDRSGEYFLVENREDLGYDKGLEAQFGSGFTGGIAIWHVDTNKTGNTSECYPPTNCATTHFMVSLEQADGNWDLEKNSGYGDLNDLFKSSTGKTSFTASTTPNTNQYDGTLTGISVQSIPAAAEVMAISTVGKVFTITASAGTGGSISPGSTSVTRGNSQTFTITPNSGYAVSAVTVDSVSQGAITTYTFTGVKAAHTISATFQSGSAITASAGTGGTISPSGYVPVTSGGSKTFTITPGTGYDISGVTVDGVSKGALTTYTFTSVTSAHTIAASFKKKTYTITASAGTGGTVTPSGTTTMNYGDSVVYAITPSTGYSVSAVTVDGVSKGAVTTYTFSSLAANHTISATFALKSFTITASAGTGGSISPTGAQSVSYGGSKTFTITPSTGYLVNGVSADGVAKGALTSYTFSSVSAGHTISATFKLAKSILWRSNTGTMVVWYMNGTTPTGASVNSGKVLGLTWDIFGYGDFNRNGVPDMFLFDTTARKMYVWYMTGLVPSSTGNLYGGNALSAGLTPIGAGDFNGDGKADILIRVDSTRQYYIMFLDNITLLSSGYAAGGTALASAWSFAGIGDFNRDGKSDVLWRNTNGQLYVWYMNGLALSGGGYITGAPAVSGIWSIKGVGDLNFDGKPDILWGSTGGQVVVWYMNGLAYSGAAYLNGGTAVSTLWTIDGMLNP